MRAIAAAATLVLLVGAGCGGEDGGVERLLDQSAARTAGIQTFRFSLEITSAPVSGSGLPLTSARGVVQVPDRIRAEVGGNYGSVPHTATVVAIGEDVWRREPLAGRWSRVEAETTPLARFDPAGGVLTVIGGVREAQLEGMERIGGVPAHKVTARASARNVAPLVGAAAAEGEVSVTLWIGEPDKLPRRVDVLGRVGLGEDPDAARTFRLSRFDQPVTIASPLSPEPVAADRERRVHSEYRGLRVEPVPARGQREDVAVLLERRRGVARHDRRRELAVGRVPGQPLVGRDDAARRPRRRHLLGAADEARRLRGSG